MAKNRAIYLPFTHLYSGANERIENRSVEQVGVGHRMIHNLGETS
jgi:hypothetical protein